jgi:hypothetical protein
MSKCDQHGCEEVGRWGPADGGEERRCGLHLPTNGKPFVVRDPQAAPTPPVDDTILAAACPAGWRRSPLDGRPVMPCLGKLLFPCEMDDVPTMGDVQRQMNALYGYTDLLNPCLWSLIGTVIEDAIYNRLRGREGLSQVMEHALSQCIDAVLRSRGEVRIRKTRRGEWEEVGNG